MDQTHTAGVGDWDPSSYASTAWDQQYGSDGGMMFDTHPGHNTGFHSAETFIGTSAHINPQISAPDPQPSLYQSYEYYGQRPSEGWPASTQSPAAYPQESVLPQGHGYYSNAQPPQNDTHHTVNSQFAISDRSRDQEYANHSHIHPPGGQEVPAHGFADSSVHPQNPSSNGYIAPPVQEWQRAVPNQPPVQTFAHSQEYNNPLAVSRQSGLQPPQNASPPPMYPATHSPVPTGIQSYHTESRQQISTQHPQSQFLPVSSGQQLPTHSSVAQLLPPARTGSPQVVSRATVQKAGPSPSTMQPVAQAIVAHVQQPRPVQMQSIPTSQTQHQLAQQPATPLGPSNVSGMKRRPGSELLDPALVAKKVKVVPVATNAGSPSAMASQVDTSASNMFTYDAALLKEAQKRENSTIPGVPNLVIAELPVKLKKGPPTKRYVVIASKGDRDPLFPDLPHGWTPAESLGNHQAAYVNAKSELDRQVADTRLEIELKRADNEIPPDWFKKLPKGGAGGEAKRSDPPMEPLNTSIKASESLRIHPAHRQNKKLRNFTYNDYFPILLDKAGELRNASQFEKLVKLVSRKSKEPPTANTAEFDSLRAELEPLIAQLEVAIVTGLDKAHPDVLKKLSESGNLSIRLVNILIRLINIGEASSPLLKAILRLFSCYVNIRPSQLEAWKFSSTKAKLEAQGNPELLDLIKIIFSNAEKNRDKDTAMAETKPSNGEKKPKTTGKPAAASSGLGSKRQREDEANGESRVAKRSASDSLSAPPVGVKSSTNSGKSVPPPTKVAAKPATTSTATTAAAPKRNLLLPGKIRAPAKPIAKPEPPKVDIAKAPVKTEAPPKAPATKPDVAKPILSRAQPAQVPVTATEASKAPKPRGSESSSSSTFAALMAEIAEPKKVKAAEPTPSNAAPDPNETDEQRKRRLRKEARRRLGLKVTFKSDDRLVEIREFTRDPEEIRQGGTVRDAKSDSKDKMEGMALKKGHAGEIRPWEEPVPIDFNDLPATKRQETFVTRGGLKTFHTGQQKFNEDRESKELMVIYTDLADIPPTPKSPPPNPEVLDYGSASTNWQLPEGRKYDEVRTRARDRSQLGFRRAVEAAQNRLALKSRPNHADSEDALGSVKASKPEPVTHWFDPAVAAQRDEQVYQLLMSDRVRNWKNPNPYNPAQPKTQRRYDYDPVTQKAADAIEDLVAHLRVAQPTPATVAPVSQPQTSAQAAPDYTAAWAQYYAQQGQQQVSQPTPQQQEDLSTILSTLGQPTVVQQTQFPAAPAVDNARFQELVAALTANSQPQANPAVPAPADVQSTEYLHSLLNWSNQGNQAGAVPGFAGMSTTNAYSQDQGRQHQGHDRGYGQSYQEREDYDIRDRDRGDRDRERDRDRGRDRDREDRHGGRGNGGNGSWGGKGEVPEHLRGINRNLIGTKQCTFYARGQCAKGDKCTFRHD